MEISCVNGHASRQLHLTHSIILTKILNAANTATPDRIVAITLGPEAYEEPQEELVWKAITIEIGCKVLQIVSWGGERSSSSKVDGLESVSWTPPKQTACHFILSHYDILHRAKTIYSHKIKDNIANYAMIMRRIR